MKYKNMKYFETTGKPVLTVGEVVGWIVDHNAIVALWEEDKTDPHYSNRIYKGMGHKIPPHLKEYKVDRIFSSIPETVLEGDVVNIEVFLVD